MIRRFVSRRLRRTIIGIGAAVCVFMGPLLSTAADPPGALEEYEVKAAFLCNFLSFVEWPQSAVSADSSNTITIVGPEPSDIVLSNLSQRKFQGQAIVLRRCLNSAEVLPCRILFVHIDALKRWPQIQATIENSPILTVCDLNGPMPRGMVIGLTLRDNRVSITVNVDEAQRRGFRLSSRLLKLAEVAHDTAIR